MAIQKGNKIERVPVIIVSAPTAEQETLDYILYNDGKPLNMLEQSEVIKRLLNFGLEALIQLPPPKVESIPLRPAD